MNALVLAECGCRPAIEARPRALLCNSRVNGQACKLTRSTELLPAVCGVDRLMECNRRAVVHGVLRLQCVGRRFIRFSECLHQRSEAFAMVEGAGALFGVELE